MSLTANEFEALDKRFSHGLNALFSYAWSRVMDNNTTSIINPRRYRTVSPVDQKHVARVAFTYQLPFTFTRNRVLKQIAGGWATSGFLTLYPCGEPLPLASNLNFRPGQTIGNSIGGLISFVAIVLPWLIALYGAMWIVRRSGWGSRLKLPWPKRWRKADPDS